MATNKQISEASMVFMEAHEQLQALKDRKQVLQDKLAEVNQSINEQTLLVASSLTTLKTLVNE